VAGLARLACFSPPSVRQDHGVDHVNDAVRRLNVGRDDFGFVDRYAVGGVDGKLAALHRLTIEVLPAMSPDMILPGTTW